MNILRRSKRILMHLYKCFRFSKVMDQMFLEVQVAVQDSFKATLGVASVFVMFPSHLHHLEYFSSLLI